MDIFFYKREEYPRPINRSGDFSETPYALQLPNTGYLEDLHKYFPLYNEEDTAYALHIIPQYPKLVDGVVIESSLEEYKLKGLVPLEPYEEIIDDKIVFMKSHQDKLDAEKLFAAKTTLIINMEAYKAEYRENKEITFVYNDKEYKNGIREKDSNNLSSTTDTLRDIEETLGASDTLVPWGFKNQQTVYLKKEDLVKLKIQVQMTIAKVFEARGKIIAEVAALENIEDVLNYDYKTPFDNI